MYLAYEYVPKENNIEKIHFHHRGPTVYNQYGYDDIDRLTAVTYHNSDMESFVMDDLGNRTGNQTLRQEGTVNFAVDPLTNRYTAIAGHPLAYDAAGNLTQDKDGYRYVYDYENRITRIFKLDGQTEIDVAVYAYDAFGRRICKTSYDSVPSAATLYYYSDNWQVLAEYDASGVQQAYFIFGNYIDEVLLMNRGGADMYYLHDHLYSPVALLDDDGAVVERYEYDAYGKVTLWNAAFTTTYTTSQYGNPFYFTGREVDWFDNGNLTLQYNRNRYLSHYMGGWFSPDPKGYVDGLNLYGYVSSNPMTRFDPLGYFYMVPPYFPPNYDLGLGYKIMFSSDEEPDLIYQHVVYSHRQFVQGEERPGDYGSSVNRRGEQTNDVHTRTLNTYRKWLSKYPFSAQLLHLYMDNRSPSGSKKIGNYDVGQYMYVYEFDQGRLISRYSEAKYEANRHARSVANYINNTPLLWHGLSVRTMSVDTQAYLTSDLFLAIKGHGMWHKAENIRCQNNYITATITLHLWDVYDFEASNLDSLAFIASEVTGEEMDLMHRAGLYRAFFVYGKTSKTVRWHRQNTNLIIWSPF